MEPLLEVALTYSDSSPPEEKCEGLEKITLRPEGGEGQNEEGGEGEPGPLPECNSSFASYIFPFFFPSVLSSFWGEGAGEAPLGRYGSPWVAAGDAGRGWDLGKKSRKTTLLAASV